MFEQALLESARHLPGARRTCSTAASLLLQSAALATFVVVPILSTHVVPRLYDRAPIFMPQLTPAPVIESSGARIVSTTSSVPVLRQPRTINRLDRSSKSQDTPPVPLHEVGIRKGGASISNLFNDTGRQVALQPVEPKKPLISVLEAGMVISRVQPIYPHLAIVNRVQGTVHLNALIASNGTLQDLRVMSGPPMLADAAKQAVGLWKFRPYVLNGKPIEVQTEIIVKFSLN